ncbi:MAG: hypothetical protein KKB34_01615 [Bacteroidetes bacterium]|nr:hypothetical protein [Bacteroidota bacterium]
MIDKLIYSVNSSIDSSIRKEYSSLKENSNNQSKNNKLYITDNNQTKLLKEGNLLNSTKHNFENKINSEYIHSAPANGSKKISPTFLETFTIENDNYNKFENIQEPDVIIISAESEQFIENEKKNKMGYYITIPQSVEKNIEPGLKQIKEPNPVFEKYNLQKRKESGSLVNLLI